MTWGDAFEDVAVCASVVRNLAIEASSPQNGKLMRWFLTEELRQAGVELNAIMTQVCIYQGFRGDVR